MPAGAWRGKARPFPTMKNTTTRPEQPTHRTPLRPARSQTDRNRPRPGLPDDGGRIPGPTQPYASQRRLYTDFLALAMYPGMSPRHPLPAA
jgi:hypothetical protein